MKRWTLALAASVLVLGVTARSHASAPLRVLIIGGGTGATQKADVDRAGTVLTSFGNADVDKIYDYSQAASFGTLTGYNAIVFMPTFKQPGGAPTDMTGANQTLLKNYVTTQRGGMVTSEMTVWMTGSSTLTTLASVIPVTASSGFNTNASLTYTKNVAEGTINAGVSNSFLFTPTDNGAGTDTTFSAKAGATSFYTSNASPGGPDGVVGWNTSVVSGSNNGRVISFSTLFGSTDLVNGSNYQQLFLNAVTWAELANTPEPSSLTLMGLAVAGMTGYGWRSRRRKLSDVASPGPEVTTA